jgi:hypothetical protein
MTSLLSLFIIHPNENPNTLTFLLTFYELCYLKITKSLKELSYRGLREPLLTCFGCFQDFFAGLLFSEIFEKMNLSFFIKITLLLPK